MNLDAAKRLTQVIRIHAPIPEPYWEKLSPIWFKLREGNWGDKSVYDSVVINDEYGLKSKSLRNATVLDIGGHIGCFCYIANKCGAGLIHSYEPVRENYDLLVENTKILDIEVFNTAIGATRGYGAIPQQDMGYDLCGRCVTQTENGTVPIITLDDAILKITEESLSRRVELLKIDCEGAEWGMLSTVTRLDLVDEIVGEWHENRIGYEGWKENDLHRLLPGFHVTVIPSTTPARWGPFYARKR